MNEIVRPNMPMGQTNWFWDGTKWCCDPDCGVPPFPCPPPGFPPPGCPPWFGHGVNSPPWYPGANAGVSFGINPPPNPVRGHFWWDGTGLALFDGAAWVAVVNAAIVPPGQTIGSVVGSTGGGGTPGGPGTGLVGPIIGVTDGSMAAAGMVGEIMNSGDITQQMPLNATGTTTGNFTLFAALPAGDWDLDLMAGPIELPSMNGTYSVVCQLNGPRVTATDQSGWLWDGVATGGSPFFAENTIMVYGWVNSNAPSVVTGTIIINGTPTTPAGANAGINLACRARRRR